MSESTERTPRTPSDDEIPSLLRAVAAAGGNVAAFARQHDLTSWKLYRAQRRASNPGLRRRLRGKGATEFAPVRVVEEACAPPLELVLARGRRLMIPRGFDQATLRRVLEVMETC